MTRYGSRYCVLQRTVSVINCVVIFNFIYKYIHTKHKCSLWFVFISQHSYRHGRLETAPRPQAQFNPPLFSSLCVELSRKCFI